MLTKLWIFAFPVFCESAFYPGRIGYGIYEYPEMTSTSKVREAVQRCEVDLQCAGFTFMGALNLEIERKIAYFR